MWWTPWSSSSGPEKQKKLRGQQPAADIILETSEGMERGCNRTLSSRWQPDKLTLRIPGHSTSRCPTPRRNPTTTYGSTTTRRKNIEDLGLEILTLLQQLWRNSDRKSNQIVFFPIVGVWLLVWSVAHFSAPCFFFLANNMHKIQLKSYYWWHFHSEHWCNLN